MPIEKVKAIGKAVDTTREKISTRYDKWTGLSLQATGASVIGNILLGIGKLVLGVMSFSVFTCVSALYTFGMVGAKCFALAGILKEENRQGKYRYYTLSGIILIITSIMYIAYSVRLFFAPASSDYHLYVALAIAAFTFTEITINIRGVIKERHNHDPLIHAIKMINLAASLICLTLTQAALMSVSVAETGIPHSENGLIGTITGGIATIIGIMMLLRIRNMRRGTYYKLAFYKVSKLVRQQKLKLMMKPVLSEWNEDKTQTLYVTIAKDSDMAAFEEVQAEAMERLQIVLLNAEACEKIVSRRSMK